MALQGRTHPVAKKLSPSQVASLAGYAAAQNLGPEGRKARASKGGQALLEKYGPGHFARLGLRRQGYDVKVTK